MKNASMTCRERLYTVMTGGMLDRPPVLGGWIANPALLAEVSGTTMEKYREDPEGVSIDAYRKLGTDGVLGVFVPKHFDDFRCVDHDTYSHAEGDFTLEETVAYIDKMPYPDEFEKTFDFDGEYDAFPESLSGRYRMVYIRRLSCSFADDIFSAAGRSFSHPLSMPNRIRS